MRLTVPRSVCVLVDVQERLTPHMQGAEDLVRSLTVLLRGLRLLGVPVIVTQQYTKGLGPTIEPIRSALGEEPTTPVEPVEKIAFGCCDEPRFLSRLEETGRRQVILAGIEAHVCVAQTCVGLREGGYEVMAVADCTSSRRAGDREIALRRMEAEGAFLGTYESVLFELTREAGTETFKSISRLVK